jgi:hypothetical protein
MHKFCDERVTKSESKLSLEIPRIVLKGAGLAFQTPYYSPSKVSRAKIAIQFH